MAAFYDDGRGLVTQKTAWSDGTSHLLFEPIDLLEKRAAVTPRPRINLVLYHGLLAPHSRWRDRVVAYRGAGPGEAPTLEPGAAEGLAEEGERHSWSWAALMRRAFDLDVLACARCGGRLRLLALIEDPRVIRQILEHLGLPADGLGRAPPELREPPGLRP